MTLFYTLFHADSTGSVVVLIMLRVLDLPHEVIELDYEETTARKDSPALRRLLKANPLAQFPTLLTAGGTVITEMSAILLYPVHRHGHGTIWDLNNLSLAQLGAFYRILVFVPAVVYPAITYAEFPDRYLPVQELLSKPEHKQGIIRWMMAAGEKKRADAYELLESLLRDFNELEYGSDFPPSKFALNTLNPSVLDVMLAVVAHWALDPRPTWLQQHCPRLFLVAQFTVNFPGILDTFRESSGLNQFVSK